MGAGRRHNGAPAALWQTVLAEHGFARFAERAVPQLIRWESAYGWSNGTGAGKVAEREIALADVLAPMLTTPVMWTGFADAYLAGLDRIAAADGPPGGQGDELLWSGPGTERADAEPRAVERAAVRPSMGNALSGWRTRLVTERRTAADPDSWAAIGIKFLRQQLAALSGEVDARLAEDPASYWADGLREQLAELLLASGRGEEAVSVHRAQFERRTPHQDYSRLRGYGRTCRPVVRAPGLGAGIPTRPGTG